MGDILSLGSLASFGSPARAVEIMYAMILGLIFSLLLGYQYQKFSFSMSDRRGFSGSVVLLMIGIIGVIMVVKSSLALSLGLVGALSIVRFRTAIKEPEQLMFYFLTIAIGLALGASKYYVASATFVFASAVIITRAKFIGKSVTTHSNSGLIISSDLGEDILQVVSPVLDKHQITGRIRRFDRRESKNELYIDLITYEERHLFNAIRDMSSTGAKVTYVGN